MRDRRGRRLCFEAIAADHTGNLLKCLWAVTDARDRARLATCWWFWRRSDQASPPGDWRTWVLLGGRGAGKTRAGAEWVREQVLRGRRRIALLGPTFHDVREVMIDGPSGLRAIGKPAPEYEPSRRRLKWPNGAIAYALSAEDPEGLRGPQFDAAWADELCAWAKPDETWALLSLGLRLGDCPQVVVTTTPKPIPALRRLLAARGTALTRTSTRANTAFLAPGFVEAMADRWAGTAYGRQEMDGELISDPEGALWRREEIEARRIAACPSLENVVVAIDPPASIGGDACGIVAAGSYFEGADLCAVVLGDSSVRGVPPSEWAGRAAELARSIGARIIVAEANNGGEMVRTVVNTVAPDLVVVLVRARHGKRARAEPVSAYYARGRVAHCGVFPALEDEMCTFGAPGFSGSPDRLDALVWALTHLLGHAQRPRVTTL
jgi:phage terminase large subunit-like protein